MVTDRMMKPIAWNLKARLSSKRTMNHLTMNLAVEIQILMRQNRWHTIYLVRNKKRNRHHYRQIGKVFTRKEELSGVEAASVVGMTMKNKSKRLKNCHLN